MSQLHRCLCDAVEQTRVGDVLIDVGPQDYEDFYKSYLHDFVRLVHMSNVKDHNHQELEYEVCNIRSGY